MVRIPPMWRAGPRATSRALVATAVAAALMTLGPLVVGITAGIASAAPVTTIINLGFPEGIAVNRSGTEAYVTDSDSTKVSVIDLDTEAVTSTIEVGDTPNSVAVNPAGTEAYVTNFNNASVSVINLSTNSVKATINVGEEPNGLAFNPSGTDAYVANAFDATVSVIDVSTNKVTATAPVGRRPTGVAVNPTGTEAFVTNQEANTVSVINLSTHAVSATVAVGALPAGIAINPSGTEAYVANEGTDTVSVINLSTLTVKATIRVGNAPWGVVVNPAGTDAYVTNSNDGTVSYIDLSTLAVTATVAVSSPLGIALDPTGTDAYVVDYWVGTVSVWDVAAPVAPGAPGLPSVIDGDHQATVSVTAPTLGGIPTSYTVTATDSTSRVHGGQTCIVHGVTGVCTVGGLTDGDAYSFTATATNPAGTSGASPASDHVVPAPPADIAVKLDGPSYATDGGVVTEFVTVTDNGPADAAAVDTTVFVPAGLTVTSAPGAAIHSGSPVWAIPSLVPGQSVDYAVTFAVNADTTAAATAGALTEDNGYDPNPANNVAIKTIRLLPGGP